MLMQCLLSANVELQDDPNGPVDKRVFQSWIKNANISAENIVNAFAAWSTQHEKASCWDKIEQESPNGVKFENYL